MVRPDASRAGLTAATGYGLGYRLPGIIVSMTGNTGK